MPVKIVQGKECLFDQEDIELFTKPLTISNSGHLRMGGPFVHNLLMPKREGYEVDHINGNKLDNRKENLRLVTRSQNCHNTPLRSTNTKGVKGVYYDKRRDSWYSTIYIQYKRLNLYSGKDFFEACCTRKSAELRYIEGV